MNIDEYEKLNPRGTIRIAGKTVTYCIPNSVAKWRLETLLTKEPDTVAWIRDEFRDDAVLLDVGANVGMYSILAASLHDMKVYAFEPESQNFALLMRNVVENDLQDRVTAFPIALSNAEGVTTLGLRKFGAGLSAGLSGHAVSTAMSVMQGAYQTTIDELVWHTSVIPAPTHIKIDVDGLEPAIIDGARATLTDQHVRSVLVEIDRRIPAHAGIIGQFERIGYVVNQEEAAKAIRTSGPCAGVGNVIFRRKRA